jgi:hypothetical protein
MKPPILKSGMKNAIVNRLPVGSMFSFPRKKQVPGNPFFTLTSFSPDTAARQTIFTMTKTQPGIGDGQ